MLFRETFNKLIRKDPNLEHGGTENFIQKIFLSFVRSSVFHSVSNRYIVQNVEHNENRESTEGYSMWNVKKRHGNFGKTCLG